MIWLAKQATLVRTATRVELNGLVKDVQPAPERKTRRMQWQRVAEHSFRASMRQLMRNTDEDTANMMTKLMRHANHSLYAWHQRGYTQRAQSNVGNSIGAETLVVLWHD